MKKLNFLPVILLFISFAATSFSTLAKEYSIPTLRIEVQVVENGDIRITEHRTYVFDGSYSWANYRLPKKGYSGMRDIQISEAGENFTNLNTEESGTFLVEQSDEAFNIKWFFNAENEERTFTVSYTLEDAIVIGPEWSEFFWTYAASGREKSTKEINILLQLPQTVSGASLHSWVREPAWDLETTFLDNGLQVQGENISRNQAVTIRTVFPTSVFDNTKVNISDADFSLSIAQQEEEEYREQRIAQAEREERNEALAWEILPFLIGISIVAFIFLYRQYGTRHKISLATNESIMLPGREKPAVIAWLLNNRTVSQSFIMATLLDLARRGFFIIEEQEPEEDNGWFESDKPYYIVEPTDKEPGTDLLDYELNLFEFVNQQISEEGNKIEDIFKFSTSEVSKWFYSWKDDLVEYCKSREWIDSESYKGLYWNIAVQSILLIGSIVGLFLLHPLMLIGLGATALMLLFSFVIIRRTPKGEELYRRWKNYRSALKNAKDHSIPEDHLGLHFIYAIAFSLGKKPIETMFEQNPNAVAAIYWIVILPGSSGNPANIASSFTNLAATGGATAGGGSFAGGASAGSAGGGASGGAG